MGMLRVLNCLALCLAPHVIYYYATELSEYETFRSTGYGALASVITASVQAFLTALYTPASLDNIYLRVAIAAAISATDVVGLWYALTKFSHRNISNSHKFQAVGVGWAAANALLSRTAMIAAGAFSTEFDISHVIKAVQANVYLVHMLSMAGAGVLFWSKKAKPAGVLAVLRVLVIAHAMVAGVISVLEELKHVTAQQALGLHTAATAALAAGSYGMWQQCNPKSS